MAGAEAAADASGPRFAPDDPTLPAPWKALIDGETLYYWNPETNLTQYDKPGAAAPPLPAAAPTSVPGAFAQPGMQQPQQQQQQQQTQQQQPQQTAQQPQFQYQGQQAQQPPFQYQQQQQQEQMPNQQGSQQPLAHQYPNAHQQPMPYQHGHYMPPQQQYSYQVGQQPQMPQTQYNQGRPPMGFKRGNSEDQFEKNEPLSSGRFDGINALHQQPKHAALPPSQNHLQDMRNGPPYSQPDNFGGYNMAPPHSVPNPLNNGPFPIGALTRPPSGTFSPPDFPSVASVDAYRQHHEVTAVGENVPPPFMTFEATGFPPEILSEVHAAGFLNPTPIQAQTWPVALQSRDIVAIAKTGSGKTLGYLIPAFVHLRRCQNNPMSGPTVLVLAPTRELASQIQDEAIKFGRASRVSCTCLYGGAQRDLSSENLAWSRYCADRMLDMGFEPQIRKIVDEIPRNRQTLMYTATWPKEVTKIAGDLLRNPVQINIGSIDELVANKSITQCVEMVPPMDKQRRLEQILRAEERGSKIIIFCSTKKMCDQLARSIGRSFGAASIHGDKSQGERDHILGQFRTGIVPVLVATDVAARGLDIKDIRVVINYDFPTGIEDYVHRIGRTGRAGATGVAYTFFSEQDWKYAADLVKVLDGTGQHVPPELQQMAARGASGAPRNQAGGMSRWDGPGGGSRFESAVGGPGGFGGIREGPGGFGGRDGPVDVVEEGVDLEDGDVLTEVHMIVLSQMDVEGMMAVEDLTRVEAGATAVAQIEAAREAMTEEVIAGA
ncbi:hypothetical protein ZWY2020_008673 [Hordeum vulgare]|nr:hypothetical protein ZWY2020_008673 [Hordeum vulgare]